MLILGLKYRANFSLRFFRGFFFFLFSFDHCNIFFLSLKQISGLPFHEQLLQRALIITCRSSSLNIDQISISYTLILRFIITILFCLAHFSPHFNSDNYELRSRIEGTASPSILKVYILSVYIRPISFSNIFVSRCSSIGICIYNENISTESLTIGLTKIVRK